MGQWCTIPLHRFKPFVKKPVYPHRVDNQRTLGTFQSMHLALDTLFTAFLNVHVIAVQTMPVSKFKEVGCNGWSSNLPSDLLKYIYIYILVIKIMR